MGTTRNPGLIVLVGVGLAVLFALLSVTQVFEARIGLGLAAISLVVAALFYFFYSRGGGVQRSGFAALLFVLAVALIIPALAANQGQAQATEQSSQYDQTLQRGAALYGQYCASCHGFQGQGKNGPKLNNNADLAKLSDDDLTRIISAGIVDPNNPTSYLMPAWSNRYGSSLTDDDIAYLVSLIRSTDPTYRSTQGLESVNGFDYVLRSLSNPTQIAQWHQDKAGGSKPNASTFVDATKMTTVRIDAVNVPQNGANWSWEVTGAKDSTGAPTANVQVKAGTKIVFGNVSNQIHNVVQGAGGTETDKFPKSPILAGASSDTYSVTLTTPGDYPYYCGIHPAMIGYITVVA